MAAISSSVRRKSKSWLFSAMRFLLADLGIGTTPCCRCHLLRVHTRKAHTPHTHHHTHTHTHTRTTAHDACVPEDDLRNGFAVASGDGVEVRVVDEVAGAERHVGHHLDPVRVAELDQLRLHQMRVELELVRRQQTHTHRTHTHTAARATRHARMEGGAPR